MPEVHGLHHFHVWELDEAHVVIESEMPASALESVKSQVKNLLKEQFHISHGTLEFEWADSD